MSLITTKNGEISSSAAVTFSAGVTGSLVLSSSYLILSESVNAPGTPASSKGALYASGSDGFLYWKNDAGNVYNLTETGSSGTGSVTSLDDLSDVDLTTTTPISGNMLSYDGTDWIPVVTGSSGGASALNDLSDVDLTTTSPVSGNVLSYDGTDWIPAVSGSGAGDVTGPGTVLDQEIVRFNGTTGKIIEGAGVRHYGASATDPSSPTPQAGDEYYNTAINHKMAYDGTRSKWLSITTLWDGAGRSGATGASSFYRRFNGMVMAATVGSVLPKCTIIGINFDANAVTHTLEVLVGGVAVAELASGGVATVSDYTIDVDVAEGIFACRNKAASATTTNLQCTVYYKLRA